MIQTNIRFNINPRPNSSQNKIILLPESSRYHGNQGHKIIPISRRSQNEETLTYLRQKVNPIISPAIHYILQQIVDNDHDIPSLFLNYFKKYHSSECTSDSVIDLGKQNIFGQRLKKRCQCAEIIKISTKVARIVSQILRAILRDKPERNLVKELILVVQNIQERYNDWNFPSTLHIDLEPQKLKTEILGSKSNGQINSLSSINLVFILLGLQNSGKTTLVSVLKGQTNTNCKPSFGFRPISLKYKEGINVTLYDLGGGVRGIWANYYHDVHGVIYVVDSTSSEASLEDNDVAAKSALGHKFLQGKPLLVINNKIDKCGSKSIDLMIDRMNLVIFKGELGMTHTLSTSLHQPDSNLDVALEWLIQKTISNISDLSERIAADSNEVKVLKAKKQEVKERRMFSDALCRSFALNGEQRSDVFDKDEGEEFLAQEIGLTQSLLPNEGKELCGLVGYQRCALMIMGKMIHKKKRSWNEALSYVRAVRVELGLDTTGHNVSRDTQ